MILYLSLFALWLILNGRLTLELCLIGLAIAAAVYIFCIKVLGYRPSCERRIVRRLWRYVVYIGALVWEILKANLTVMRTILHRSPDYHPAVVRVHVPLREEFSRVLLANSITLTPGTVTVAQEGEGFLVLCLEKESGADIAGWSLTRMLERMEGDHAAD